MIKPSCDAVLALKFLQKSMMLTPCGPSAVPTGGAGVACHTGERSCFYRRVELGQPAHQMPLKKV